MKTRRTKLTKNYGSSNMSVIWFGSAGSKQLLCSNSLICANDQIIYSNLSDFYNENDKHDNFSSGQQGVVDGLRQKLSVLKHELWYNISYGLPLFDKIKSKAAIDAHIVNVINTHRNVTSIESFASSIKDKKYTCSMKIVTDYGMLTFEL